MNRDQIAAVLAKHVPGLVQLGVNDWAATCTCGWQTPTGEWGQAHTAREAWRYHIAEVLTTTEEQ